MGHGLLSEGFKQAKDVTRSHDPSVCAEAERELLVGKQGMSCYKAKMMPGIHR